MYSTDQIQDFKKLTDKLLKHINDGVNDLNEAAREVIDLRDVINFHDHMYYVQSEAIITDFEYDKLFKRLKSIEDHFPALASEDSPTNRIARGLTKEFPTVEHIVPMLSLDNSYNEEDLVDFDRKVKDLSGLDNINYTVEPKFDGGSISLVYENDRLIRGATRGDGIMGEEITPNIKAVKSIPLKANFSKYGIKTIEIRGEVIIQKEKFKKYNEDRAKEMNDYVTNIAKGVGLTFNFDKAVVANSFDAHRFSHFAKKYGLQHESEEALFKAYFTDGKNTSNHQTLIDLGVSIGMDANEIKEILRSNAYVDDVKQDAYEAYQIGVQGVPFFVLDNKYAVSGAQESATFLGALTQAWEEHVVANASLTEVGTEGEVCTPESC